MTNPRIPTSDPGVDPMTGEPYDLSEMDAAGARALLINIAASGPYWDGRMGGVHGCLMCEEPDEPDEEYEPGEHADYCLWREVRRWVENPMNHPIARELPERP